MAIDITLNNISAGYSLSKINENFERIATALQDSLSRSGTTPNEMFSNLDMNSRDIINIGNINLQSGESLTDLVNQAELAKDQAVSARDITVLAEANAQTNAGVASQAATDAEAAKLAAQAARDAAQAAKNNTAGDAASANISAIRAEEAASRADFWNADFTVFNSAIVDLGTVVDTGFFAGEDTVQYIVDLGQSTGTFDMGVAA